MIKRTLVIGASPNPDRYSNRAMRSLARNDFPVVACGLRGGFVNGIKIEKPFPDARDIHTITMYIGPRKQSFYYNFIYDLAPRRVIFNPGTENPEFEELLRGRGIEVVSDCTLILLANGEY